MLLNLKIIIICFVFEIGLGSKRRIPQKCFVNIVKADEQEVHCSGGLTNLQWAVTSKTCINSLQTTNLVVTAAHTQSKGPEQIREVISIYSNNKEDDSILLLKLKTPFDKTMNLDFYKLPEPKFKMCKVPKSLHFELQSAAGSVSARKVAFLLGMIYESDQPAVLPTPPPSPYPTDKEDDGDDDDGDYEDSEEKKNRRIYFKSSKLITIAHPKQKQCKRSTGNPLVCGDVIIGVEIGCKPHTGGGVELKYANIYRSMPFILKSTGVKRKTITAKPKTGSKSEARVLYQKNYIWKNILLALMITLLADMLR